MKLKYFGTAAAEGVPSMGCNRRVCENARKLGGKDVRFRTQALIDDGLLIDLPPDAYYFSIKFGVDYGKIHTVLISHGHPDHYYPTAIRFFKPPYVVNDRATGKPLTVYAGKTVYDDVQAQIERYGGLKGRVEGVLVQPFLPFETEGYAVTPVPAFHDEASSPFLYRIEKDGKSILWAHDTGVLDEKTLNGIEKCGQVDLISLDCCGGFQTGWTDHHLSLDTAVKTFEELEKRGVITPNTVKIVNHF
ncbi:MAG: MBL fold metallo-hydrolase, partial [Clostridia bacterium]|nr:MBL fold metallo-hydrolase [Clostridia bacterium]